MTSTTRFVFGGVVMTLFTAGCELQPTNPYDCEAPLSAQQPVTIRGRVQAITAPIDFDGDGDKEVPPPGGCGLVDGDHSGFQVVLRGLGAENDNTDVRVTSQETTASGEYVFVNAPPGDYVVEVTRPGFATPPPVSVSLRCGEEADLGARCALKTAPPEAPTLEPLPEIVGHDDALVVRVSGCDPELVYRLRALPQGGAGLFFDDFTTGGDVCERELTLSTGDDAPQRRTWRVEVSAVDALGNESPPAVQTVVQDTLAPGAPTGASAVAGPDRVFLSWQASPALANDDAPAGYLVSYGIVPRPEDAAAACPFGAPSDLDGDGYDQARFAVEGPSPLLAATTEQVLSGIAPGTELYLQLAAYDVVGNLSCWTAPLFVRPDVVTPGEAALSAAAAGRRLAVEGPWRAHALGDGGVALYFEEAAVGVLAIPADDVAIAGGELFAASGASGVLRVTLPDDGSLPTGEIFLDASSPVRSIAVLAGRVFAGTDAGLVSLDLSSAGGVPAAIDVGDHGGPVLRVVVREPLLALVRGDAGGGNSRPDAVQVAVRADGFSLLDELPYSAEDLALHDGRLWIARGTAGLDVYDLRACNVLVPASCAVLLRQGPVSPESRVAHLMPWDDVMLVGADALSQTQPSGGLFFFRSLLGGVVPVGRAAAGPAATVHGLEARAGEVCLTVKGTTTERRCHASVVLPVLDADVPLTQDRVVQEVVVDGADVWSLERGEAGGLEVVQRALASGVVRSRHVLDESEVAPGVVEGAAGTVGLVALAAVPNLGALALDNAGRVYFAPLDGPIGPLTRVDEDWPAGVLAAVPALGSPALGSATDILAIRKAELVYTGAELLAIVHTAGNADDDGCFPLAAVRAPLTTTDAGALVVTAPSVASFDAVWELGPPRVHRGEALVPTSPFGVLSATTAGALETGVVVAADEACREPGGSGGPLSAAQALEVTDVSAGLSLLLTGQRSTGGSLDSPGLYELSDGTLTRLPLAFSAPLFDVHRVGGFVIAHSNGQGALLFAIPEPGTTTQLTPLLSLPSIPTPLRSRATGRGSLVAGGSGGLVWNVLR